MSGLQKQYSFWHSYPLAEGLLLGDEMNKVLRAAFLIIVTSVVGAGLYRLNDPLVNPAWAAIMLLYGIVVGCLLLETFLVQSHSLLFGFLPRTAEIGGASLILSLVVYLLLPSTLSIYFSISMAVMLLITLRLSLGEKT